MYNVDKKRVKNSVDKKKKKNKAVKRTKQCLSTFSTTIVQESVNKTMKGRTHRNADSLPKNLTVKSIKAKKRKMAEYRCGFESYKGVA